MSTVWFVVGGAVVLLLQHFRLVVGEVIKRWDTALGSMQISGKRAILVPPNLGYGRPGAPPGAPGKATTHPFVAVSALLYFEAKIMRSRKCIQS